MGNMVTNVYVKLNYGSLRIDKALGIENLITVRTTFVALGDSFRVQLAVQGRSTCSKRVCADVCRMNCVEIGLDPAIQESSVSQ